LEIPRAKGVLLSPTLQLFVLTFFRAPTVLLCYCIGLYVLQHHERTVKLEPDLP
jgi:hypothetical protein